jgi:hypothetical protein
MAPLYENQLHIDVALSDFAIGYGQDPSVFIAERVAPPLYVPNVSDYFWVGGKEAYNVPDVKRVKGALFPRVTLARSTDRYSVEGYGIEVAVTREEVAEADAALTPEQDAVSLAVDTLKLNYERRVAALVQNTSVFTQTAALAADDQFSNPNSDPISLFEDAKEAMNMLLGVDPNLLILGRKVFKSLRQHPDLIERVKYVQMGKILTQPLLADFLGISEIIVPTGMYNSKVDQEPGVEPTLADIWGDACILMYVDPSTGPMRDKKVTPIRTFVWAGSPSGGRYAVERYYEPQTRTNVVQCTDFTDEKAIETDAVYSYTSVI